MRSGPWVASGAAARYADARANLFDNSAPSILKIDFFLWLQLPPKYRISPDPTAS
jgi:hypothetical protein